MPKPLCILEVCCWKTGSLWNVSVQTRSMFINWKKGCICYVDDLLFWSKDEAHINELAILLHHSGSDLEQEDDAASFLGVWIEHDESGLLDIKQEGLIDHVIEALGLGLGTMNGKATLAKAKLLVQDTDGEVAHGDISYSSVVDMMFYLSGHFWSNIAYAFNCAACYMFFPRLFCELALKRIGRYIKATHSRGLILSSSSNLKIDYYPDADFSGMYGHKKMNDLACVKSRTGHLITVADCSVLCQSKLQSETAVSTMEPDVIVLAHTWRELLPIMDMIAVLGEAVGLQKDLTTMNVSIMKIILEHWFCQRHYYLSTHLEEIIMLSRPFSFVKR